MKYLFALMLFWAFNCQGQIIIDTFQKAVSSTKLFQTNNIAQGIMANGHPYCLNWNIAYPAANFPVQFVRVDLFTKKITTLRIDSAQYYIAGLIVPTYDSAGNLYISGAGGKGSGHVFKLNLKDTQTIHLVDLGQPFAGHGLYSMGFGRDGNIYLGTGGDSRVGFYNPRTGVTKVYAPIDIFQNYILSIAGDSDWIYSQVGQKDSVFIYATRKSDGANVKLSSNPASTRYTLFALKGACIVKQNYASYGRPPGTYYLINGTMLPTQPGWVTRPDAGIPVQYIEVPDYLLPGHYYNSSAYDPASNYLFYTHGFGRGPALVDSVHVPYDSLLTGINGPIFTWNDTVIYYKGNVQYGNMYKYNVITGATTFIGSSPTNFYSGLVDKRRGKGGVYLGGYPSGAVEYYDTAKPWTCYKIINGKQQPLSNTSNPRLITYFKTTGTHPAGFHHAFTLNYDYSDSVIVASGDVIRIASTIGIGSINANTDSSYGIDYTVRPNLSYQGCPYPYKKWFIFPSGADTTKAKPYLFYYNAQKNTYDDSICLPGFNNYGNIFIVKDTLFGLTKTMGYKVNLTTKKLTATFTYYALPANPQFYLLSNGLLVTSLAVPASFYPYVASFPGLTIQFEHSGVVYATTSTGKLVRIKGLRKIPVAVLK